MSFLKPQRVTQFTQESLEKQTHLVAPTSSNIWEAGTTHLAPLSDDQFTQAANFTTNTIRSARICRDLHDGESVQSYLNFVPIPTGLSQHPAICGPKLASQKLAIEELGTYAGKLLDHMQLDRTGPGQIGSESYAANQIYDSNCTIENLIRNMNEHNLCLQATVSHPNLSFRPFCTKITADDLTNCMNHTEGLVTSGVTSKFLKCTAKAVPDSMFFHIVQDADSGQHRFYSVNYTKRNSF